MTSRPTTPPGRLSPTLTDEQRRAIENVLGPLEEPAALAVRDARGLTFQRLEFLGDAVLELVVRTHAVLAGASCPVCGGDADAVVTDASLAAIAGRTPGFGDWLEWQPTPERLADLVEASAGAVWTSRGWAGLTEVLEGFVHPLAPFDARQATEGAPTAVQPSGRSAEILGASVLEVAAVTIAYRDPDLDEGALTRARNLLYGARRVVDRAEAAGWIPPDPSPQDRRDDNLRRDLVERRLAEIALTRGLEAAVHTAVELLER